MKKHFLLPGRIFSASGEVEAITVLGSCVSVVLFDKTHGVVGLCHYLLPENQSDSEDSPRYGECAINSLIESMEAQGASMPKMEARIYGGAELLSGVSKRHRVGLRNVELAEEMMAKLGIPVREREVGGNAGRKIVIKSSDYSVTHTIEQSSASKGSVDITGFGSLRQAEKVRVVIVDDSVAVRNFFTKIFEKNGLKVVGTAANPFEARELIVATKPSVVTLDIEMPHMNGVQFLEKLMKHMPTPVVMVSSLSSNGAAAFKALKLGAVEFVEKPSQSDPMSLKRLGQELVQKVRAAALVDMSQQLEKTKELPDSDIEYSGSLGSAGKGVSQVDLVLIGGNTGSQDSLLEVLSGMPDDTPPVVVTNPTITPFLESYIESIREKIKLVPLVAENGMPLQMGKVYFSPGHQHTLIKGESHRLTLELKAGSLVSGHMPSATALFGSAKSVAASTIGVLLGGFGSDGVAGLEVLHNHGAMTIVQDPRECLFPHIPQSAIQMAVVDKIQVANTIAKEIWECRNQTAA